MVLLTQTHPANIEYTTYLIIYDLLLAFSDGLRILRLDCLSAVRLSIPPDFDTTLYMLLLSNFPFYFNLFD